MDIETVSTRDLCTYIGDDSKEALDRLAQWATRGLFNFAGCGPIDQHVGRGRARQYPAHARYWAAAFRRLFDKGFSTRDVYDVISALTLRAVDDSGLIERVVTEGRPVWLSYIRAPIPETPGTGLVHGGSTLAEGVPSLPVEWGSWKGIVRCVDLAWLFSPGHE
jgi:hypothetical protein